MIFMYFLHLVVVYLVMWMPTALFMFVVVKLGYWPGWVAGGWSHVQGFVSVAVSLHKPDIRKAFFGLLCCRWDLEKADAAGRANTLGTGWSTAFFTRRSSMRGTNKPETMNGKSSNNNSSPTTTRTPATSSHITAMDSHFIEEDEDHNGDNTCAWEADDVHQQQNDNSDDNVAVSVDDEAMMEQGSSQQNYGREQNHDIPGGHNIVQSRIAMSTFRDNLKEQLADDA